MKRYARSTNSRSETRYILCPLCNRKTKVIIWHKSSEIETHGCADCLKKTTRINFDTDIYEAYFLPKLEHIGLKSWKVIGRHDINIDATIKYLEQCLAALNRKEKGNGFIISNSTLLSKVINDIVTTQTKANADQNEQLARITNNFEQIIKPKDQSVTHTTPKSEVNPDSSFVQDILWEVLPPGEHPFSRISEYLQAISRNHTEVIFDLEKIRQVLDLRPSRIFTGKKSFRGYIVFFFDENNTAVLESPLTNNAIYIVRENWQDLSRLSKAELLRRYGNIVTRVVHSGDWVSRLKRHINK